MQQTMLFGNKVWNICVCYFLSCDKLLSIVLAIQKVGDSIICKIWCKIDNFNDFFFIEQSVLLNL